MAALEISSNTPCRLCFTNEGCLPFSQDKRRVYLRCPRCSLVFVPDEYVLDGDAEKAEYDKHENDVNDAGYRKFLSRAAEAVLQRMPRNSPTGAVVRGLDFGCGPGPALAQMLEENEGWHMDLYDVYYRPDNDVLDPILRCGYYHFITMTEVIEHLQDASTVLRRLWHLLSPGGFLVIMTKRVISQERFHNWHYKNDPTHIAFFSDDTFHWIGRIFFDDCVTQIDGPDVVVLTKLSPEGLN